jgi:hypothetical protein
MRRAVLDAVIAAALLAGASLAQAPMIRLRLALEHAKALPFFVSLEEIGSILRRYSKPIYFDFTKGDRGEGVGSPTDSRTPISCRH